jgi:hypothetical protein
MKYFLVGFVLLAGLCLRPEILYPFDTVPGRTLLLAGVIYLVQLNEVLGLMAAIAVSRVIDRSPPVVIQTTMPPDRMRLANYLRPQASLDQAFFKTGATPDPFDPFFYFTWV